MPRYNLKCTRCQTETEVTGDVHSFDEISQCDCGADMTLVEFERDDGSAIARISIKLNDIAKRIEKLEEPEERDPEECEFVTIH